MADLNAELAAILEVDSVAPGDVLADFELWDSLTALSVIAMLDEKFGVQLNATELRELRTVGDLAAHVQNRARA